MPDIQHDVYLTHVHIEIEVQNILLGPTMDHLKWSILLIWTLSIVWTNGSMLRFKFGYKYDYNLKSRTEVPIIGKFDVDARVCTYTISNDMIL